MKQKKNRFLSFFDNMFGFESGIDISDDCAVLYRRNVVIKNIIFLSNIVYTLILAVLSFGESSNWVLTIILFPVTFVINNTLKKMINRNPGDILKQQIAMYIACFYMFLSAILLYFKLKTGGDHVFLGEAGYILLYYSLVVVSLYQDKKMIKTVFKFLLVIITLLHFTVTYNVISADYATNLKGFLTTFFVSKEGKDIILRTIILIAFMVVVYSIVSMGQYMQEERKKELLKRKQVQDDFTNVVIEMFDVTLNDVKRTNDEKAQNDLLALMSEKLASLLGMNPAICNKISDYVKIQYVSHVDFDISKIEDKEEQFEHLRAQTKLGNLLAKRLQLENKCENIIRAHEEGWVNEEFIDRMLTIQNDRESQVILMCDMYMSLRSLKSYKRPYPHRVSVEQLDKEFKKYFDSSIYERFVRFQDDFEKMYNEY